MTGTSFIKKDLDEHIQEFGERLDTIVIEDIIMPEIIELLEKDADTKKLKVIFDYFEDVCINSDDYLNNVFSITIVSNLSPNSCMCSSKSFFIVGK